MQAEKTDRFEKTLFHIRNIRPMPWFLSEWHCNRLKHNVMTSD